MRLQDASAFNAGLARAERRGLNSPELDTIGEGDASAVVAGDPKPRRLLLCLLQLLHQLQVLLPRRFLQGGEPRG